MINRTTIILAKKYETMIEKIYKDSEGYWIYSEKGFYFDGMGRGCHTAHEITQREVLTMIRTLSPCTCELCQ
jgi:hypothetical protein